MKQFHFAGIDLLRFLSALFMVVFHLAFLSWAHEGSTAATVSGHPFRYPELTPVASLGWIGVEIFFVISGFVVIYSAHGSAWHFLRSRVLRLAPAAWICASISAGLLAIYAVYPLDDVVKRFIRSAALYPKGDWVDGVYWTLGIELAFYALILMVITARAQAKLVLVLVGLGLVSSLYLTLRCLGFISADVSRAVQLLLLEHGVYFAIGGLIWALLCNEAPRRLWAMVALFAGAALLEIAFVSGPIAALSHSTTAMALPALIWLASVIFLVSSVRFSGFFAAALPVGLMRKLGLATYPLYLVHSVVGASVLRLSASVGLDRWSALTLAIVVPVLLSLLVALYIEPHVKGALARVLDSKPARPLRSLLA